jgi:hypothetical protein
MRKAFLVSFMMAALAGVFNGCGPRNHDQKEDLPLLEKDEQVKRGEKVRQKEIKGVFLGPNVSVILGPMEKNIPPEGQMELVLDSTGTFRNINGLLLKDLTLALMMRRKPKNKPIFVKIIVHSDKDTTLGTLSLAIEKLLSFAEPGRRITIFVGVNSLKLQRDPRDIKI